ncbi:hypothetical protein JBE27_38420 [Streptomyces albiflaviniger]|nr:hypothetical protein [Streptomyces albiflaviniger]
MRAFDKTAIALNTAVTRAVSALRMTGTIAVERMDGAAAAQAETEFRLVYAEEPYEETPESIDANFRRFTSP